MLDSLRRWTRTEHALCQEDLSAYLDGQLTSRENDRVEKHLATCAQCRADLEALRHTVALLRMVPDARPSRSFLLPAGEVAQQRGAQRWQIAYTSLRLATTVATTLLVLVVSGDAVLRYALPLPAAPISGGQAAPTVMLEQPATGDEETAVKLLGPEAGGREPTVDSQPQAVVASAPTAGATSEIAVETMDAGEMQSEPTPPSPAANLEMQTKTRPPHTSAVPAAPPSAPISEPAQAPATPMPEEPQLTATPLQPTAAPVPPTTVPEPTATPVPPTVVAMVREAVPTPAEHAVERPLRQGVVGIVRPILPLLELVLATVTLFLLVVTLWMRRRQGAT
jgi:anti-sigma factor RsiW